MTVATCWVHIYGCERHPEGEPDKGNVQMTSIEDERRFGLEAEKILSSLTSSTPPDEAQLNARLLDHYGLFVGKADIARE